MLLIHILIHLICVKDIRIKKSNYLSKVPTLIKQIFPPKAMWMLQLFWNQHSHLHIEKVLLGESYGFTAGTFSAAELKDEVEKALNEHFGYKGVERHDKSIKVTGNTYRVDADVVPAYRYRDYSNDWGNNPENYIGGIEIRPDSGGSIINFPEQHIKLGIAKIKIPNITTKNVSELPKICEKKW